VAAVQATSSAITQAQGLEIQIAPICPGHPSPMITHNDALAGGRKIGISRPTEVWFTTNTVQIIRSTGEVPQVS
jgi:hypothetical protein